jgi:hypothetical protein
MGGKDTPAPPDYEAAAERTAEGNLELLQEQTRANRPTQVTPWGTSSWEQGEDGNWTQNIQLTPEQQQALNSQLGIGQARSGQAADMLGRMRDEFGDVMNWDQFNEYTTDISGGEEARQAAIDASYGQATSRLDPRYSQRREQTEAQLRNQGLRPGDEAYDTAMANLGREETDAYNQAMYSAILTGGQEGERDQRMDIAAGGYGNTVRQAQIAEEMQRRGFTLNEINALLSGQQVAMPNMPGFVAAGRGQGADYTGAAAAQHGAEMDAFSADQAWMNSLMSGAGSAAMMFSDIRLKHNVKRIGKWLGHNVYTWTWIWGQPGCGVMAHEMPEEYVAVHRTGYLMVDYGRLVNA